MRTIIAASLIFLFWFMLSGHTEALLIVLGILSTLLSVYLSKRMNIIDHESYPFHLSLRLLRYYIFLGKEIIKANIDVIKRIIIPGQSISPQVITLPASKKTDLSKVIYANSITLTPGTVTLELSGDEIKVHALSKEGAEDLQSGEMARAVPDNGELIS
jgi:multicomponent Na+:H+ antiporter subunit E